MLEKLALLQSTMTLPAGRKGELALDAIGRLDRDVREKPIFLALMDHLCQTAMITKHDFRYTITPQGKEFLRSNRRPILGE